MTARRGHGALKADILDAVVRADTPLTARQVRETFAGEPRPSLATVLTVLDRLRKAGEVTRAAGDGELVFSAARRRSESTARQMIDSLLRTDDRSGALLSFAGSLDDDDLAVLRTALGPAEG